MKPFECNATKDSITKVFDLMLENSNLSKMDISKLTSLSRITTSKIVDSFHTASLFKLNHEKAKLGKNRSKVYSLNRSFYFAIYDLSDKNFTLHIYDIKLSEKYRLEYRYDENFLIDDNFRAFADESKIIIKQYKPYKCLGTCILFPGEYNADILSIEHDFFSTLSGIGIQQIIDSISITDNVLFINKRTAIEKAVAEIIAPNSSALCFTSFENILYSCTVNKNQNTAAFSSSYIGKNKLSANITFEEYLEYQNNNEKLSDKFYNIILELRKYIKLDNIYLFVNSERFTEELCRLLSINHKCDSDYNSIQPIYNDDIIKAYIGSFLRNNWLNSIMNNQQVY